MLAIRPVRTRMRSKAVPEAPWYIFSTNKPDVVAWPLQNPAFGSPAAALKVKPCSFREHKIYAGHGRPYTRTDWKVFQFFNVKCESAFLFEGNPQQINWTVHYKREHRKVQLEEIQKKRTCRTIRFQRTITSASLADIMTKRNQELEVGRLNKKSYQGSQGSKKG
ncbi:hypothetical protein MC885_013752 [Smutsia gigantea]|nr:hypothetical protein MC885_013752 [Smutsia gigantea]